MLCASPERFLARAARITLAAHQGHPSGAGPPPRSDEAQRLALLHDEKERAENLMIVDLVRNDLARVARTGTVRRVPELFGLYPLPPRLANDFDRGKPTCGPAVDLAAILRATFPMGSMTGRTKNPGHAAH